ncbi:MAG: hypothetical protein P1U86_08380 [Verrucomicrobiales bacterium]|nr:hypothetical protein [Verrucomicrobiales bacterium]
MKNTTERERLLAAVSHSRRELRDGLMQTREAADFTSRAKASVQKNLFWWIGGAVIAGICVASATGSDGSPKDAETKKRLSASRKKSFRSMLSRLGGVLISLSSPLLKAFLTREIAGALSKIGRNESADL